MQFRRIVLAALVTVVAAMLSASPAAAHTGLDATEPAAGSTVAGPLETVVLDFTGTPTVIDGGVFAFDAAGTRFEPVELTQDGLRITARFDPPLAGGSYAVSWIVRSDDTHTIDGSFGFAVTAPATTLPAATAPATTRPAPAVPATTVAGTTVAPTSPAPTTTAPVGAGGSAADEEPPVDEAPAVVVSAPAPTVAADIADGEAVARMGRLVLFPAAVVAIGVLTFAAFSFAGRRDDLAALVRLVRWLGVGVAVGATLEVLGLREVFGAYGELLGSGAGRAAVGRVAAGLLLAAGFGTIAGSPAGSLSAAVLDEVSTASPAGRVSRWRPGRRDVFGLLGVVVLVVSFAFDGHTVSEGPRVVHALANVAHVAAASVWAGGVVALAVVLWRRHRAGVASAAVELIVRFSVVAMVSLGVAGAAGLLMAWLIESDLGAYLSTDWGRLLLVKMALVLGAVLIGGYNHFRLLPRLEASPDDDAVVAATRSTVTTEAVLLVTVAFVTALLVGASTI